MTAATQGVRFRRYVRVAAVAFLLVTAYSVTSKLLQGRLALDWLHSVLHMLSAAAAIHAGWLSRTDGPARLFTVAVAVGYTLLGVLGWFIPGFLLHSAAALPLDTTANVFHLLLGLPAIALLTRDVRRGPPTAGDGRAGRGSRPEQDDAGPHSARLGCVARSPRTAQEHPGPWVAGSDTGGRLAVEGGGP